MKKKKPARRPTRPRKKSTSRKAAKKKSGRRPRFGEKVVLEVAPVRPPAPRNLVPDPFQLSFGFMKKPGGR